MITVDIEAIAARTRGLVDDLVTRDNAKVEQMALLSCQLLDNPIAKLDYLLRLHTVIGTNIIDVMSHLSSFGDTAVERQHASCIALAFAKGLQNYGESLAVADKPPADVHPGWSADDASAASQEGWNVFRCGDGQLVIQADDEKTAFKSDMGAYRHVDRKAKAGSPLHARAIALCDASLAEIRARDAEEAK